MDNLEHQTDWKLIESCKKRDDRAWKELVERHEGSVRLSIREKLGDKAKDSQLVEDRVQDVFMALIDPEYKRLGRYNPKRGCFDTFLKAIAAQIVERWRSHEGPRTEREIPLHGHEPLEPGGNAGLAEAEFAEFREDLTASEDRCLRENLMGEPSQHSGEEALSAANARQLKHRLQKKAERHFDTG